MFRGTNFGLLLRIRIVNAIIFTKNIGKLVPDQFLQIAKDPQYLYFGYVNFIVKLDFFKSCLLETLNRLTDAHSNSVGLF